MKDLNEFLKLYQDLPITVHNKKQNVIKKRWIQGYNTKLENIFQERLEIYLCPFLIDLLIVLHNWLPTTRPSGDLREEMVFFVIPKPITKFLPELNFFILL